MNDVEYNFLKNQYDLYKVSQEDNAIINKRIEELEENELVQEYKKLISRRDYYSQNYGSTLSNESDFINKLLSSFTIKEDSNIYVEVDNNFNKKYYGENSKVFRKLERSKDSIGCEKFVLEKDLKEFEKDNIVIYPPKDVDKEKFFKTIQTEYFKITFNKSSKHAYKYLLSINSNKNN